MQSGAIQVRQLGRVAYEPVFRRMAEFSRQRNIYSCDEIWVMEHEPVFTLGKAADKNHILDAHCIPVYKTDRGGEVTYHGPGQLVVYLLIDLRRRFGKLQVRELVFKIEDAIIHTLSAFGIAAERHAGAPGVYIPIKPIFGNNQGAKIAALGLKVGSNGCMYHGLALNVAMDLEPFTWIDPCGYQGLSVTDMRSLGFCGSIMDVQKVLLESLSSGVGLGKMVSGSNGEMVHGGRC